MLVGKRLKDRHQVSDFLTAHTYSILWSFWDGNIEILVLEQVYMFALVLQIFFGGKNILLIFTLE
jgi:hypothetical protein